MARYDFCKARPAFPTSESKRFSYMAIDQHIDHNDERKKTAAENAKDRMVRLTELKQVEQDIEHLQHQRDPVCPGLECSQSIGQYEE